VIVCSSEGEATLKESKSCGLDRRCISATHPILAVFCVLLVKKTFFCRRNKRHCCVMKSGL
jgi:hypothetical protein